MLAIASVLVCAALCPPALQKGLPDAAEPLIEGTLNVLVDGEDVSVIPDIVVSRRLDGVTASLDVQFVVLRNGERIEVDSFGMKRQQRELPFVLDDPPEIDVQPGDVVAFDATLRLSRYVTSTVTATATVPPVAGPLRLVFSPESLLPVPSVRLVTDQVSRVRGLELTLPRGVQALPRAELFVFDETGTLLRGMPVIFDPNRPELPRDLDVGTGPFETQMLFELQGGGMWGLEAHWTNAAEAAQGKSGASVLVMQPKVGGQTGDLAPRIGFDTVGGTLIVDHGDFRVHSSTGGTYHASKIWVWREADSVPPWPHVDDAYLSQNLSSLPPVDVPEIIHTTNGAVTPGTAYYFKAVIEEVLQGGRKTYWTCASVTPLVAGQMAPADLEMPLRGSPSWNPPPGAYPVPRMESLPSRDVYRTGFSFGVADAAGQVNGQLIVHFAPQGLSGTHDVRITRGIVNDRNIDNGTITAQSLPWYSTIDLGALDLASEVCTRIDVKPTGTTKWVSWYHTAVVREDVIVYWPASGTSSVCMRGSYEVVPSGGVPHLAITLFSEAARPFDGWTPTAVRLTMVPLAGEEAPVTMADQSIQDGTYVLYQKPIPSTDAFATLRVDAELTLSAFSGNVQQVVPLTGSTIPRTPGAEADYLID